MKPLSPLQHTLLVEVFRNPRSHGYALLQHGARASVYDALNSLTARGLVARHVLVGSNAPSRKTYSITRNGRLALACYGEVRERHLTTMRKTYLRKLSLR